MRQMVIDLSLLVFHLYALGRSRLGRIWKENNNQAEQFPGCDCITQSCVGEDEGARWNCPCGLLHVVGYVLSKAQVSN